MAKETLDLAEFEVWLAGFRESHRAGGPGSGRFAAEPGGEIDGRACADFVVIDYTLGPWPPAPSERDARVKVLRDVQSPDTGLFEAAFASGMSADSWSATAYFAAALELLGARPLHPLRAFDEARAPEGMESFFSASGPVEAACRAAAVAACFAVTGDVGPEWFERCFALLARRADPRSGPRTTQDERSPAHPVSSVISVASSPAGALGLCALHERFRRPLPHPAEIVSGVLGRQGPDGLYDAEGPGWTEVAAAYVLDRGLRHWTERWPEVRAAMEKLLRASAERLGDEGFRAGIEADPHRTAGIVSLAAVLSQALPGSVRSRRPLRFYLDRHLFA